MITTVTINASLDKVYFMKDTIQSGTVMRVSECRTSAGGKGLNVARVAALCGSQVLATGLAGGYNGQQLESLLEKDGIPYQFCHVQGETRCCINILDPTYGSTEYLEPGCQISETEEQQFMDAFPDVIRDSQVVTISGSIPQGVGKDIYGRMISLAKNMGKTIILDSSGETLIQGMKAKPDMVKPNQDELEQLFQTKISGMEDVIFYGKKLRDSGIPYVVISLGKDGALLICEEGIFQGTPPKLKAVNTVGCGDSMVAAFAVAFERNYAPADALNYAVAVASANAMSPKTGDFDPEICEKITGQVKITRLSQ